MDSKQRFSNRVENYVRYRPRYPDGLIELLEERARLVPQGIIADLGSGTGFSAEPFLTKGYTVYAVEPNPEMRQAAERFLGEHRNFHSIDGSAEAQRFRQRAWMPSWPLRRFIGLTSLWPVMNASAF